MDSFEIYHLLRIIEDEPSTNAKIALLEEFLEDHIFKNILQMAYDPYVTYGIINMRPPSNNGDGVFNDETFQLLSKLGNRQLTGNTARDTIAKELERLDLESATLFCDILKKDLRAGINTKTINKAAGFKLIPIIGYMRCSLQKDVDISKWHWNGSEVIAQEKMDGIFINYNYFKPTKHNILTRTGHSYDIKHFSELVDCFERYGIAGYQYHGEIIVHENGKALDRKTSNGIMNHVLKGKGGFEENQRPIFIMWDMIPINVAQRSEKGDTPYVTRFNTVKYIAERDPDCPIKIVPHMFPKAEIHVQNFYEDIRERGGEGVIVKTMHHFWKSGTSKDQVKIKAEKECELEIYDFLPGKGKFENTLGSLSVMSDDQEVLVNISGFTDEFRDELWNNKGKYMSKIVTVRFNEIIDSKETNHYSLFLPRFVELRTDKDKADNIDYIMRL